MRKVIFRIIIFFQFTLFGQLVEAENVNQQPIKLAIIDNFKYQINSGGILSYSSQYVNGIEAAKYFANKAHTPIQYKIFTYGQNPLDVLSVIPSVKSWNPDVIIGPRSSNIFLLLNNQFKNNILILSPLATSPELSKLPSNFYSTSLPDQYVANAITDYIKKTYSSKGLFSIIQADCKNCVDLSELVENRYCLQNHIAHLNSHYFIEQNVKQLNMSKLLSGYHNGDLILMANLSYDSAILMPSIVNYLKKPIVFIGSDDWGSWDNTETGKINANYYYEGIHFTPWGFEIKTKELKDFLNYYNTLFNAFPKDMTSYESYNAAISMISALQQYGSSCPNQKNRDKILCAYSAALKNNPNWYRPKIYAVYRLNPVLGEKYLMSIKISNHLNHETK